MKAWRAAAVLGMLAGCGGLYKGTDGGSDASVLDGGGGGPTCDAGFHGCSGACVADDSVEQCGSECRPCPQPPNSLA